MGIKLIKLHSLVLVGHTLSKLHSSSSSLFLSGLRQIKKVLRQWPFVLLPLSTTKWWFLKRLAGRITEERGKVESFQRKKIICVPITFCPRAKLCLHLFLADNQHYPLTFVAISAAGEQMDSGNDLIDAEFRKNGQLLWAILTPGEDLRGDNNDCTGFSFLAKTVIWHGRSNFNMLVDDSTVETHTYYRDELYPIDFPGTLI